MRFAAALVVATVSLVFACDGGSTGERPTGDAANGETLYVANCETCHGADAKSGSAGEDLVNVANNEEDEWFEVVTNGKDNGAMPAFGADLSEQEMADILAYVAGL